MTATDELRRLLDERGVAHSDHYLSTTWRDRYGTRYLAGEPMADGSLVVDMLTPEQAIAATLGSGTLTADDVRDSIERHSDASGGNGRIFHNGAYEAIADELNATLGAGECKFVGDAKHPPKCSACGWQTSIYDCRWLEGGEYEYDGRFCKQCGRKVEP